MIANQQSQTVWRWDNQEPFGSDLPNDDPGNTGNPFVFNLRFPGQYFDRETNLNHNYFRDYDPAIGLYVESDPVGLRGGRNTYAYVNGDPLSSTDPLGLNLL
jgi:RHS repeat-associated protein